MAGKIFSYVLFALCVVFLFLSQAERNIPAHISVGAGILCLFFGFLMFELGNISFMLKKIVTMQENEKKQPEQAE